MSEIHLRRHHRIGLRKAKAAVDHIAEEMSDVFDIVSEWQGNTLKFSRSGVHGELKVTKDDVTLNARLGLLLSALKPRIEEQIAKNFDKYFGGSTR